MEKEIGFNLEREDDGEEPLEGDRQGGKDRPDPEDVNEAVTNWQNRWKQFFLKINNSSCNNIQCKLLNENTLGQTDNT